MSQKFKLSLLCKCVVLVFFIGFLCSCTTAKDQYLIWRIEKDRFHFWVMGVTHSVLASDATPPEIMFDIYDQSEIVSPESFDGHANPFLSKLSNSARKLAEPIFAKLVSDHILSEELVNKIRDMPAHELSANMDHVLPATQQSDQKIRFVEGYDAYFYRKAQHDKTKMLIPLEKRIRHQESWDMHCGSDEDYLKLVQAIDFKLRNPDDISKMRLEISKFINKGDLEYAAQFYSKLQKQHPIIDLQMRCSAIPRSKEWARTIGKMPGGRHKAMILVGANHVIGQDNFIALLEQQGFKATRVKVESK